MNVLTTDAPETTKLEQLESDKKAAIASEDYEKAAKIRDEINQLTSKEVSSDSQEELKALNAYSKEELSKLSNEQIGKLIANDLRTKSKNFGKWSNPEDVLSMYKNMLNSWTPNAILEKQNKELKEIVFDKNELIISPAEYLRRSKLIKMKKLVDKLKKNPDYPRNAVAYFVSMTQWRKLGKAPLKRSLINSKLKKMKVEDLKSEMKFCLDKFTSKPWETAKTRLFKKLIHDEIAQATNGYMDGIIKKNRI